MYDFHNKYIGTKYNNSANLLFTKTDSLVYEIETGDVYEDFYEIRICLISVIIQKVQKFLILSKKSNW